MKIKEVLDSKKVSISFEIFPPKKQSSFDSVMNAALNLCSLQPDFMSVTYGAGGSTKGKTTEIANKLQSNGNTVSLAHLTCVGSSKEDIKKHGVCALFIEVPTVKKPMNIQSKSR